eukprot:g53469.t1
MLFFVLFYQLDRKTLWSISLAITTVCVTLAMLADNIGTVLGFNGSIFGVLLVYVLPAVIFLRLDAMHNLQSPGSALTEPLLSSLDEDATAGSTSQNGNGARSSSTHRLFNTSVSAEQEASMSAWQPSVATRRMLWRGMAKVAIVWGALMGVIGVCVNIKRVLDKAKAGEGHH